MKLVQQKNIRTLYMRDAEAHQTLHAHVHWLVARVATGLPSLYLCQLPVPHASFANRHEHTARDN